MIDGVKVHPTFLYESIWNLLVFGFLVVTFKKRKFYGEHLVKYMMLYSVGRFFIEGLRTDSLMFGPFRVAQMVSLFLIVVGGIFIFYVRKKKLWEIKSK